MFSIRKTDSYDLVGTNARNSNLSMESNNLHKYGPKLLSRLSLEASEVRDSQLEQVLNVPPLIGLRQSSISSDPLDYLLTNCTKSRKQWQRDNRDSMVFDVYRGLEDNYVCDFETPFDCEK